MTREMITKRLREMAVETGGLNCLGCGFEHNCGIHGCAVLKTAAEMIENAPPVGRCGTCRWFADNNRGEWYGCKMFNAILTVPEDAPKANDFCSCYEPKGADK